MSSNSSQISIMKSEAISDKVTVANQKSENNNHFLFSVVFTKNFITNIISTN